ncbi:collagen-like protein [Actinomyces bowdenii]|uniref:Collagen-like protein n=1 Tax=Actinomyces bowdenii TaxID=131109 RepID=A0A3P1V4U5_9ACTO|nr:collagen-like protein [Actinomyces bowdenii]MBO3725511.1 collagen-like protein [Actinomyces bowdenii]RRD29151.1 collagen-like protein [Actinomyces bowdenii]
MTQPQTPGQPYYPQQPSAPSAPIPGQPYPPQMPGQQVPGAPMGGPAPGQPYPPQAPAGDSFVGNLFDTSKGFVERFGKIILIVATVAFILNWLYAAYTSGDIGGEYNVETGSRSFAFGEFLVSLLVNAPWAVLQIGLVRLFIELVANSAKRTQG